MSISKVVSGPDAVSVLRAGDVVASCGYAGHGVAEQILVSIEERSDRA
jgi:acyl CoA:acetate/3-ketoacid CoA transferase